MSILGNFLSVVVDVARTNDRLEGAPDAAAKLQAFEQASSDNGIMGLLSLPSTVALTLDVPTLVTRNACP
jgi:hypothetical protein